MEGDAGTGRLNPTDDETDHQAADDTEVAETEVAEPDVVDTTSEDTGTDAGRRPTRIGPGWALAVCATLLVLAGAAGAAGYLAVLRHHDSEAIARSEAAALQAAKDCVAATQAPDTAAMATSQAKIIECSTGDFGAQAPLYSGMLLDAYQAANVTVAVSDMRAAVEKHNDDGSMDVLVALRVKVTNIEVADQEQGYRLRVRMAPVDGTYKVDRLDQVAS
jgi:Mce-associated membrane protein